MIRWKSKSVIKGNIKAAFNVGLTVFTLIAFLFFNCVVCILCDVNWLIFVVAFNHSYIEAYLFTLFSYSLNNPQ